jgi:hypothetical protein
MEREHGECLLATLSQRIEVQTSQDNWMMNVLARHG